MLFIFSALYPEVQELIQGKKLKRREHSGRLSQFINEEKSILLTLTGVGEVPAAASVAAVLSRENAGKRDMLLSLGSCALLRNSDTLREGSYVLLNSLKNQNSGRRFYPDIPYHSDFPEGSCLSGSRIISTEGEREEARREGYDFYDMEAAAIYEAGNLFLGPEQLCFLRLISDRGEGASVSPKRIRELSKPEAEKLFKKIEELMSWAGFSIEEFTEAERAYGEQLSRDMKLSKTLTDRFLQELRYLSLSKLNWRELSEGWYSERVVPCRDKRSGQRLMEELWKHFHTST